MVKYCCYWNRSFPTLLELINENTHDDKHIDGVSFKKSLIGDNQDNSQRPIFWHSPRPRPKSTGDPQIHQ